MRVIDLKTKADYLFLLELNGYHRDSFSIYEDPMGIVVIIFFRQRFKAWLKRKRLLKLINDNRPVSVRVEIALSLGTPGLLRNN